MSSKSAGGITKGMKGLKVGSASKTKSRRSSSSSTAKKSDSAVTKARRRLSVVAANNSASATLDGQSKEDKDKGKEHKATGGSDTSDNQRVFTKYASLSKVGYVPFNPSKVNQDRAAEVINFGNQEHQAFFGCFDGHGSVGHQVSEFISTELPRYFLRDPELLAKKPEEAIEAAFVDCNTALSKSNIDCTFSGTTGIVCYITGKTMYSCNLGDSRAVMAKQVGPNKYEAVKLSEDHKPEDEPEKARILASGGRVEACKGLKGEDIGPARVWLKSQDVPGLAMTRSFGDLIAASVGVIPRPEVWKTEIGPEHKFIILASDGVWEFMDNQEAVDLVGKARTPEAACRLLVAESVARWQAEEEVIDDITAVVLFLNAPSSRKK